jgi:hypothetical protein
MTAKFSVRWHLAICPVFLYVWAGFFVWVMGITKTRLFADYRTFTFLAVLLYSFAINSKGRN